MASPFAQLKLYWSMLSYARRHNRDFAAENWSFFDEMRGVLASHGREDLSNETVLDVGCGKSGWLTLLCASVGADATGIDTEVCEFGKPISKYVSLIRKNGIERTVRTLGWELLFARQYYAELERLLGKSIAFKRPAFIPASVTAMPCADDYFSLVVSHEVFEHLDDVEGAVRELYRVMKPGGLTYIYVHNFASISGGHHIEWKYPDTEPSSFVPPWDHLRQKTFPDIPSWINGVRAEVYREVFERYFTILEWRWSHEEGKSLLTNEIREELAAYDENELLRKGFTIIATPKTSEELLP